MTTDPTKRFTERADNYVKYRPGYPDEAIDLLQDECGLAEGSVVADIGAGTGIFTKKLLNKGYTVYAVEPNQAMRQAAKQWLGSHENYTAVDAIAEATTLPPKSIDMVVCAQAFHWFNSARTRAEFKRILKDDHYAALIWNNRQTDTDEFSRAYENLLKNNSVDYNEVNHRNIRDTDFKAFFKDEQYKQVNFSNAQVLDLDGFLGRAFSSSYVPPQNSEAGKKFREILEDIFGKYNINGTVSFKYKTEVYLGHL